uniref:Uncharacterized protein n=1 Tax=uncultured marine virus TaxID=186617 RepID=A0A0F7KZU9_9VIRU|nr:hypothetical protein [uncultured marine virus]
MSKSRASVRAGRLLCGLQALRMGSGCSRLLGRMVVGFACSFFHSVRVRKRGAMPPSFVASLPPLQDW